MIVSRPAWKFRAAKGSFGFLSGWTCLAYNIQPNPVNNNNVFGSEHKNYNCKQSKQET